MEGRNCQRCQRTKISRHCTPLTGTCDVPNPHFKHIQSTYSDRFLNRADILICLSTIDHFTHWPQVNLHDDDLAAKP